MNILIMDTHPLITEPLSAHLKRTNHEVLAAKNAAVFLSLMEGGGTPDVLIAEQGWAMTHRETLEKARAIQSHFDLILVYDQDHGDVAGIAEATGACAFLRQPLVSTEISLLLELVRKSRLLHYPNARGSSKQTTGRLETSHEPYVHQRQTSRPA